MAKKPLDPELASVRKVISDYRKQKKIAKMELIKEETLATEWYTIRSMLGYTWAMFLFMIGGREAGKSYAVCNFYVDQYKHKHRPFYWIRLTKDSAAKLLKNNAEKLVDPDIRRKYHLDLVTRGENVYNVLERDKKTNRIKKKELMCRVLNLSTFYADKGSGLFDKDFLDDPNMYYNIAFDEMNREKNERNSFDIVYSFANQIENLIRSTKKRVRIICIGNTLDEVSDLLASFNFLPEKFGRYKLKKKRAVIDYIEPTEEYLERRKGTAADILMGNASTFTNRVQVDKSLIYHGRLTKPQNVIQFSKDSMDWYTLWSDGVIAPWHKEKKPVIAMKPYIDQVFDRETQNNVIVAFDSRAFRYKDLITFKKFQKQIELLKPRG